MKPSTVISYLITGVLVFVLHRNVNERWTAMEDQLSVSNANSDKHYTELKRMFEAASAKEPKISITNMIPQAPAPIVHIEKPERSGPENLLIPPFKDNLDELEEK